MMCTPANPGGFGELSEAIAGLTPMSVTGWEPRGVSAVQISVCAIRLGVHREAEVLLDACDARGVLGVVEVEAVCTVLELVIYVIAGGLEVVAERRRSIRAARTPVTT
jgi:hypothetical protein